MNVFKAGNRKELFLFFLIALSFVPVILLKMDGMVVAGLYLLLLAFFFSPILLWFRDWWVPVTLGLIILLPGPLDRVLLSVQLTPEEGVNPIGIFSVVDLMMFFSICVKYKSDNKLNKLFNARVSYVSIALLIITFLGTLSAFMSFHKYYTFYFPMALRAIFYSIRFLLVFAWISNFFEDLSEIRKIPVALHLITLGFILLVFLSPADNLEGGENRLSVATYGLNTFGHLLTFTSLLCIPFFIYYLKQRQAKLFLLIVGCFLTCVVFLLMSANRMSFGLLLFGGAVYIFLMPAPFKRKVRTGLILLFILATTIFLFYLLKPDLFTRVFGIFQLISGDNAFEDIKELQARFVVWSLSLEMILDHPILGIGPGQWNYMKGIFGVMPSWMTSILDPHNGYLLYASEMGLVCMLIYYSIILCAIRRGYKAFVALKKIYKINPTNELNLYLSFILILCITICCWLLSDLTNASGLNIRVQSLMWSLCSILLISPSLSRKFIEKNEN